MRVIASRVFPARSAFGTRIGETDATPRGAFVTHTARPARRGAADGLRRAVLAV